MLVSLVFFALSIALLFFIDEEVYALTFFCSFSTILLLIELAFNHRHLFERLFICFSKDQNRTNFIFTVLMGAGGSLLISFSPDAVSSIVQFLFLTLCTYFIGMAWGNTHIRRSNLPNSKTFPWGMVRIYERSLNPNIRKTYGPFIFVIIPLYTVSIIYDPRIFLVVIALQLDNIYTRLRATVPISLFLTTRYQQSLECWIRIKEAAAEFSIPNMVLGPSGEVPKNIGVQQDLLRLENDKDWIEAIRIVSRQCKYIIFDTHSYSDALGQELQEVIEGTYEGKILFIQRPVMDHRIAAWIERLERSTGAPSAFSIEEICHIIATDRDMMTGMSWRPSLQKKFFRAERE